MDLSTIRTNVLDRLGVPSGDALFTTAVLNRAINAALDEIGAEHDWPWLEASETINTVAGTKTYTPNAAWVRTRELKLADDYPLEWVTMIQLDTLYPVTEQDRPSVFAIEQGQLYIGPTPDGVYVLTHRYVKAEPDLSADGDTPLMPAQFHNAIVELATYIALKRSRDDVRGAAALDAYARWLSKMHRFRRRHTGPSRIKSRWD